MALTTSTASQIIMLYDQGYTQKQIAQQLRIPEHRVRYAIKQATMKGADSRRLFEVH